jgi:hypothetical protein
MYNEVKTKLEQFPTFRERRFRGPYLVKLALRSLGLEGKFERQEPLTWSEMEEYATRFDGYRHAWTDVTKDHEELRGEDYEDKEVLEQKHVLGLGYEPGFHELSQVRA